MVAITVRLWIDAILTIFVLGILLWAFVDCLIRRKEAFPAIGTMPKAGWLLVIALLVVLTYFTGLGLFGFVGAGVAAYYLLDLRRGLREATEGPW
ncbi:DUF2516 family protein [Catellatospora sp. NPDC049133]|jgi:hypothetical protein|uniref:DUF2516 family protein n=1 Tax=Catellatospora sp. NPDC049133 TaxID=3155499 RepID=UPI0033F41CF7